MNKRLNPPISRIGSSILKIFGNCYTFIILSSSMFSKVESGTAWDVVTRPIFLSDPIANCAME